MPRYGLDPTKIERTKTTFKDPYKWHKSGRLRAGSYIFVCSWSDFWIEDADEWRGDAWDMMTMAPDFRYMILTKRPHLIAQRLPAGWGNGRDNVLLGITAENSQMLRARYNAFRWLPAKSKFISFEPLLGPITLITRHTGIEYTSLSGAIVGGETGSKARPMHPVWARNLRDDCLALGVPFTFKQWGRWQPVCRVSADLDGRCQRHRNVIGLDVGGRQWRYVDGPDFIPSPDAWYMTTDRVVCDNELDGKHHLEFPNA